MYRHLLIRQSLPSSLTLRVTFKTARVQYPACNIAPFTVVSLGSTRVDGLPTHRRILRLQDCIRTTLSGPDACENAVRNRKSPRILQKLFKGDRSSFARGVGLLGVGWSRQPGRPSYGCSHAVLVSLVGLVLGRLRFVDKIPGGHEGGRSAVCANAGWRCQTLSSSIARPGSFLEREFP
jgi:hypothetical protein